MSNKQGVQKIKLVRVGVQIIMEWKMKKQAEILKKIVAQQQQQKINELLLRYIQSKQ